MTSARWQSRELLEPITPAQPCGENLEDTELLASFDAFRIFGQARPLDAPVQQNEKGQPDEKRIPKPPESPEWREIRDKALDALGKSKDLRLLACLGTALLRTDGVPAFAETLNVAAQWLDMHWSQTYPLVDEDAILRRNALNCLADPMAVVDALRKVPLVRSRQHGAFSLRDFDAQVNEEQVRAAFASMPIAELTQLQESVVGAVASLKKIDAKMRDAAGSEATPTFDPLMAQFAKMSQALRVQVASHPESTGATSDMDSADSPADGVSITGVVKSRQDVVRVLDAAADFFRRTEPSSPIPLLLARAKRLVSKDFREVLADIAPDAVAQARAAGGLKDGE
ncbi:type VI secretion system protein TssA [soil metagenome]